MIADTLRRDHLDAWGYGRETAPTLTRLAAEGVRFDDAVAQAVWTKVSVPSILSGIYPTSHGIVDFADRLPAAATTLAEAFQAAGYATFATSAWEFTGQLTNLHQGVEVLYEGGSVELPEGASDTKTGRFFVDQVLDFVQRHREMLDQVLPEIELDFFRRFELPTRADLERTGLDVAWWREHEIGWYDGSIRGLDAEIARLVDRLDHSASRTGWSSRSWPTTARSSSSTASTGTASISTAIRPTCPSSSGGRPEARPE